MISPVLFASLLSTFLDAPRLSFNNFINSLNDYDQNIVSCSKIENYDELYDGLYNKSTTSETSNNVYKGYSNPSKSFDDFYNDYTWSLIDDYDLTCVSASRPVTIGGNYFTDGDMEAALKQINSSSSYGGCGPRAIIGILDYLARYKNYTEIMANPYSRDDRIALAVSVLNNSFTINAEHIESLKGTFMGINSYVSCINQIFENKNLQNVFCAEKNISLFGGNYDNFLNIIISNIQKGMPTTIATITPSYSGDFANHYANIYGIETWQGLHKETNELITKKFLKASMYL